MTVARPSRKKPTLVSEITRTLQAFDIITEEMRHRVAPDLRRDLADEARFKLLEIADRIAARTED